MAVNLSALCVRLLIGGVDYSDQMVGEYSFGYEQLQPDVAGAVLPFSGQFVVGLGINPINNRKDFSLFALETDVEVSFQWGNTWYPMPPMEIKTANFNSKTCKTTIVCGDCLYLASSLPQDVDSRALDITIGYNRSGAYALSKLLIEANCASSIFREADSPLRFRYPRSLGTNYISAASDIANSEGVVVFTAPSGQIIVRETWTVGFDPFGIYQLPVLGEYRCGERTDPADTIALNRQIEEFCEITLPTAIANKYTATASYYEIFETPSVQVTADPGGNQDTTIVHDFGQGTVTRTTNIRDIGANLYAGIANTPTGAVVSEIRTEDETYEPGEPGRLFRQLETHQSRVAKIAGSLRGWHSNTPESLNNNGDIKVIPFPGALWTSLITSEEVDRQIFYQSGLSTVIEYEVKETRKAAIDIFVGLTNGVPWDLIVDNSPVPLDSLQFASRETIRWVEEDKGSWTIYRTRKTVKALDDTGWRSSVIGGLQRAASGDLTVTNGGVTTTAFSAAALTQYWLTVALQAIEHPTIVIPSSPDNIPPAFTPKPRRYRGEGAQVTEEESYQYLPGTQRDVSKSVSIPFVSDEWGSATGNSAARNNAKVFLRKIARRDRMESLAYELTSPAYPEILAGFSPMSAMDVYVPEENETYRVLTHGLTISGNAEECAVHCLAPTLARLDGNNFIYPYNEQVI